MLVHSGGRKTDGRSLQRFLGPGCPEYQVMDGCGSRMQAGHPELICPGSDDWATVLGGDATRGGAG